MSSFTSDLLAVLKSRGTVIVTGLLTSVITARYLGPEGNGVVATLIVYPNLFMIVGSLGIRQSAAYYMGQKKYDESDILASVINVWLFTSIIGVAICYILLKYFTNTKFSNTLLFLTLLPVPFALLTTYVSGLFLGKNAIKDFNTVNWVPNVVKLIAYVLVIMILPWDVYGALIGIALGYILLTFFVWAKLKKMIKFRWTPNWEITKKMLSLGSVYALSLMIINLNYRVDVALLEHFAGEYQVGIYTKGVSIVEYLWEIPTVLSTIIFARSATSNDPKAFSYKVCQLLRICFIVISLCSVAFYFLSTFIMVTMYSETFRPSSMVQKILLPGILLLTVFKILNMDLAGRGKPWLSTIAMIPALVINAVLNCLWDSKYGGNGAAWASTISYSISAIVFLVMYSNHVKISIKEIFAYSKSDFDFIGGLVQRFKKKPNKTAA
ncbi:flippase [Mucilaginibacter sp. cycad4]|uniref:flippase n=1 Tax=Mucilaginibacter sp. cycad4 TaxID=3342096 RepID=UPI002AAB103B|nr:flippase [Mucilaginibacter gossypii]WPV00221.1 flippase [Mucilaginibacter gossypii]